MKSRIKAILILAALILIPAGLVLGVLHCADKIDTISLNGISPEVYQEGWEVSE